MLRYEGERSIESSSWRDSGALRACLVAVLVLAGASSSAQDRPSLERIEAVMCAQADEQGQRYRPIFCDPTV